jgi:hypothetical protein
MNFIVRFFRPDPIRAETKLKKTNDFNRFHKGTALWKQGVNNCGSIRENVQGVPGA